MKARKVVESDRGPLLAAALAVAALVAAALYVFSVPAWEPLPIQEQSSLNLSIDMTVDETREALGPSQGSVQLPADREGNQWSVTRAAQVDVDPRLPFAATTRWLCLTAVGHEVRAYEQQGEGRDARCNFAAAPSWWVLNETGSWAPMERDEAEARSRGGR